MCVLCLQEAILVHWHVTKTGEKLLSIKEQWNPKNWVNQNECLCVFVRENFYFFILGYDLAIDQVVPSFSFDWQQSQHLLKLFFSFLTFPFTFFFNFIFLSSSPEIHHSSMQLPSVIFDLFGSVCLNQREGTESILTDVQPYNDFLP